MAQPNKIVEHAGSGLMLPEATARRIDELSKGLPSDFHYKRMGCVPVEFKASVEEDGSKTDVSLVTTDDVDRDSEVVLPSGIALESYKANPVVCWAHDYATLPLGKSMWIRPKGNGLVAMTKYAAKPAGWPDGWLPDAVHSLMREGMCVGKSIGFLPVSARAVTSADIAKRPEWKNANRIIDKAILLEYSVVPVPANGAALTLSVSKALKSGAMTDEVAALIEGSAKSIESTRVVFPMYSRAKAAAPHSFSSTQFDLPDHAAAAIKAMSSRIADDDLAEDGREADPHLTLHYGLHTADPEDIRKAVEGVGPVSFNLGSVNHFPAGDERTSDVVKVEASGPGLHSLKKRLTALPHSNSHAEYQPHITLAYCKPGAGAKYDGMEGVKGMTLTCKALTFSGRDGKKTSIPLDGGNGVDSVGTKAASESVNADGGTVVPAMPVCPKCMTPDKVSKKDDGSGMYTCSACNAVFKDEDAGDVETMGVKDADATESKTVATAATDDPIPNCPKCRTPMTQGDGNPVSGLGMCDTFACEKCGQWSLRPDSAPRTPERNGTTTGAPLEQSGPNPITAPKAVKPFVRPETIAKARERARADRLAELKRLIAPAVREAVEKRLGRV